MLSKTSKTRISSQKLLVFSLLLSATSIGFAAVSRHQHGQRCEEIRAQNKAKIAAFDELTRNISNVNRELEQLDKAGKLTTADIQRFKKLSKEYKSRIAKLKQP